MSEITVNINKSTHETLLKIASDSGETIQVVLDKAIENYRRTLFLIKANQAFTDLRKNDELWLEELSERLTWEMTLTDGED